MNIQEDRDMYAMKANILWEIFRSIKQSHAMIYAVPGVISGSPTCRITTSSCGLDTPKDVIVMVNETGNLLAYRKIRYSVFLEVDISDPESLDKIRDWVIKRIVE